MLWKACHFRDHRFFSVNVFIALCASESRNSSHFAFIDQEGYSAQSWTDDCFENNSAGWRSTTLLALLREEWFEFPSEYCKQLWFNVTSLSESVIGTYNGCRTLKSVRLLVVWGPFYHFTLWAGCLLANILDLLRKLWTNTVLLPSLLWASVGQFVEGTCGFSTGSHIAVVRSLSWPHVRPNSCLE